MLKGCLESLCNQTLKNEKYEIIVVDNNSSDETFQIVKNFLKQKNIRYYMEMKQGVSHSRNRGVREAKGKYVAYIDDDARANPDWLEVAFNLIKSIKPSFDCLGGTINPFYTSMKPFWFDDKYEIRGFGDIPKFLKKQEYISGSNMIWKKDILNEIRGFNFNVGVVGNHLRLGEETNAFENLWSFRHRIKIYYSPALIVYHWVPDYKMTVSYRLKRKFAEGQFQVNWLESDRLQNKLKFVSKLLFYISKASIRFILRYEFHPQWQNWVVEDGIRIAFYSGKLLGILGVKPRIARE